MALIETQIGESGRQLEGASQGRSEFHGQCQWLGGEQSHPVAKVLQQIYLCPPLVRGLPSGSRRWTATAAGRIVTRTCPVIC